MRDAALFTKRRSRPISRDVADHLRSRIVAGELRIGRQLPSMRRLARLYGVSVPTIQAAMRSLEAVGFVRIRHGVGSFVSRPRSASRSLVYAWLEASPIELAAMRMAIDERTPVLAAEHVGRVTTRATVAVPAAVRDLAMLAGERAMAGGLPAETFVRNDLALHEAIAATIPGFTATSTLHRHIGDRLTPNLLAAAESQAADHALSTAHVLLVAAVRDGESASAGRLARAIARREARDVTATLG